MKYLIDIKLFLQSTQNMIDTHLAGLSEYLNWYTTNYEKNVRLRDFNVSIKKNQMNYFCDTYCVVDKATYMLRIPLV